MGLVLLLLAVSPETIWKPLNHLGELGWPGMILLGTTWIPAAILLLPATPLTLAAGFLFGPTWGTVISSAGSTVGATLAFLTGRSLARNWVADRLGSDARLRALEQAVARHGMRVVLLARLSPWLPYNLLNYGLGLTRIHLGKYVLASWAGMLPGTVLYASIGSTLHNLADLASGQSRVTFQGQTLFVLGLIATAAVVLLIARLAHSALSQTLTEIPPAEIPPAEIPPAEILAKEATLQQNVETDTQETTANPKKPPESPQQSA